MNLGMFDDVLILLEEGNMSRAARRCNVTQPAFSRRIQSFEDWLGRKIITRSANRIEIDPALSDNTSELQALIRHIEALRQRIAQHESGRISVTMAAQHSLIVSSFADFAVPARKAFPQLDFRLRAANRNDCISLFLSGEASLLMCYERQDATPTPFDDSILRVVRGKDRVVPVVGGPLRFALTATGLPPDDTTVIRYRPGSFFAELLDSGSNAYARHPGPTLAESAFTVGIKQLVLAGLGLAWLPMSLVYNEVQSGALTVCNNDNETLPLLISLFARPTDPIARQLVDVE